MVLTKHRQYYLDVVLKVLNVIILCVNAVVEKIANVCFCVVFIKFWSLKSVLLQGMMCGCSHEILFRKVT